jgi:DsbC/DsbD-like thiol-disulfide interchange protein
LRRYPAIARELETGDPGTPTPQPHESPPDPVRVYASADRLTISSDTPALITLRVEIQPGYAVASADPGDFGVPFRVDVTGGSGVAAYADYPPSRPVYAESFDLPVVIERTGPWAGTPLLNVRWQACRNQEPYVCLPPRTVELDIALDRG